MTDEENRFLVELEFVQCLANPQYIQCSFNPILDLSQQQYFKDPAFINYLEYLKYWQKPEYSKYIMQVLLNTRYPYCLEILEFLQKPDFRDAIASAEMSMFLHQKEFFHWQFHRNNRSQDLDR